MPKKTESVVEVDEAEAKRQRKLAKRAAKEAAAAEEEEAPVPEKKAKKTKKAADAEEAAAAEEEVDPAEAKRQRKAAKKAAKEAAAAAEAVVEEAAEEEVDEAEAKKQRKAAKKAAKEAAAKEAEAEEQPPKKSKKKKQADDDEAEEAPAAKKSKTEAGDTNGTAAEAEKTLKVFVKGLPYSVTEAALRKDFEECGAIERLQFPLNEDGSPRGFAFITYVAQEGVDAALKFDGTDYGGRNIGVALALENGKGKGKGKEGKGGKDGGGKGGKDNTNTVFIRGLPFSATEAALNKDFAECGEVETLRLPLNEEGQPKGICFVKYKTQEGVDAALKFDSTEYGGRTIYVSMAGEGKGKDGKGKGKDGKDGKGKDGKGKGKKGKKGKAPSEAFAKSSGAIVESTGEKKTFEDSDDE